MKIEAGAGCRVRSILARIRAGAFVPRQAQAMTLLALALSQTALAADPQYSYRPTLNHDPDVCGHMARAFNVHFADLWQGEAFDPADESTYSATSRYAFPKVPGVEHSTRMTFDMRSSKVPSSPEFDAIPWQEARAVSGGPTSPEVIVPVLIAYVDFDNDGQLDTVMKSGFVRGYSYIDSRSTAPESTGFAPEDERIRVWRSRQLEIDGPVNLWELVGAPVGPARPLIAGGVYVRPFLYEGRVYVARYSLENASGQADERGALPKERREEMSVESYRFTGEIDELTKGPRWTTTTVCRFDMQQIDPAR